MIKNCLHLSQALEKILKYSNPTSNLIIYIYIYIYMYIYIIRLICVSNVHVTTWKVTFKVKHFIIMYLQKVFHSYPLKCKCFLNNFVLRALLFGNAFHICRKN
jgi:hypothetical protein